MPSFQHKVPGALLTLAAAAIVVRHTYSKAAVVQVSTAVKAQKAALVQAEGAVEALAANQEEPEDLALAGAVAVEALAAKAATDMCGLNLYQKEQCDAY